MIQQLIQALADTGEEHYSQVCKVVSVSGNNCICQPVNGDAEIQDVRLAANDSAEKFVLVPEDGSDVVVTFLNKEAAVITMVSKVKELRYKIGTVDMVINANGYQFKKGNNTLWDAMKLFIEALQQIMVLQGNNPDFIKLQNAKLKFKDLLNGS